MFLQMPHITPLSGDSRPLNSPRPPRRGGHGV